MYLPKTCSRWWWQGRTRKGFQHRTVHCDLVHQCINSTISVFKTHIHIQTNEIRETDIGLLSICSWVPSTWCLMGRRLGNLSNQRLLLLCRCCMMVAGCCGSCREWEREREGEGQAGIITSTAYLIGTSIIIEPTASQDSSVNIIT